MQIYFKFINSTNTLKHYAICRALFSFAFTLSTNSFKFYTNSHLQIPGKRNIFEGGAGETLLELLLYICGDFTFKILRLGKI